MKFNMSESSRSLRSVKMRKGKISLLMKILLRTSVMIIEIWMYQQKKEKVVKKSKKIKELLLMLLRIQKMFRRMD